MDVAALAAGGVVLLAMVAISVWGATTLAPGSSVPVHFGLGGWRNWQPKTFALITYPVIGGMVFALMFGVSQSAHSNGKTPPAVIAPVILLIVAVTQYSAIRAALRESGGS